MKKLFTFIISLLLFSNLISAPTSKWFRQIFGCTWNSIPSISCTQISQSSQCSCTYTYTGGYSWLWGSCNDLVLLAVQPCETWWPQGVVHQLDLHNKKNVADYYAGRISTDANVDILWTDSANFNDSTVFLNAVKYRVQLAGYIWDDDWFTMESDPCPVPIPTETVTVSQFAVYCNPDCGTNIVVYPNPNSGIFTIDLEDLGELVVNKIEIIKMENNSVVYSNSSIDLHYDITLDVNLPQDDGIYYIVAYTSIGVLTKSIVIE